MSSVISLCLNLLMKWDENVWYTHHTTYIYQQDNHQQQKNMYDIVTLATSFEA